jgi:uncharacterized protein YjiS (DUF1127 family)
MGTSGQRIERNCLTLKEKFMTSAHVISPARQRIGGTRSWLRRRLGGAWQAYWIWQRRRTTVRILASLDDRTLRDIGIHPSEITSYAYGDPDQRRRICEESWRLNSHG